MKTAIAKTTSKTKKTTNGKATATPPNAADDILEPADRKKAARLLKNAEEPLDVIWSLIGGPISFNMGVVMAYAEGLSYDAFCELYDMATGDKLHLSEAELTLDARWEVMRELLLPAMFTTEVESAFDNF